MVEKDYIEQLMEIEEARKKLEELREEARKKEEDAKT